MSERVVRRNSEVLAQYLDVRGRRVLDAGCGDGNLLVWLVRHGAEAVGLDPEPGRVALAAARLPQAWLVVGRGELLPFARASFDFVIYFNSLHHLRPEAMDQALAEAFRVLRPTGRLAVFEPLAEGAYFEVMLPVEDESRMRAAAYGAILRASEGRFALITEKTYITWQPAQSVDELLADLVRVDPRRAERIQRARADVEERYRRLVERDSNGRLVLSQPMRFDLLAPRAR
ncbi:putative methyltransferase [bacterium HR40]|nr:putative methyltransferase [bacterium HR40]